MNTVRLTFQHLSPQFIVTGFSWSLNKNKSRSVLVWDLGFAVYIVTTIADEKSVWQERELMFSSHS